MKESKEIKIVQQLNKALQHLLETIVALENLLPASELFRLIKMLDDAGNDNSVSAKTIFGLSAIAGFSIANQVEDKKKKVLLEVAGGN